MLSSKGFFLSMMLLCLGIVFLGEASANNFNNFQEFNNSNFQIRSVIMPNGNTKLVADINQNVYGQDLFKLKKIFNLNQMYSGFSVKKVVVVGQGEYYNYSQASLIMSGMQQGPAQTFNNLNGQSKLVFFPTQYNRTVGRGLGNLQLQVQGNALIQKIKVILEPGQFQPNPFPPTGPKPYPRNPRSPRGGNVSKTFYVSYQSYGKRSSVSLAQLVNLPGGSRGQLSMLKISSISVTASGMDQRSGYKVCEYSSCSFAERLGNYDSTKSFPLNRSSFDSVQLQLSGQVSISQITVNFTR